MDIEAVVKNNKMEIEPVKKEPIKNEYSSDDDSPIDITQGKLDP